MAPIKNSRLFFIHIEHFLERLASRFLSNSEELSSNPKREELIGN